MFNRSIVSINAIIKSYNSSFWLKKKLIFLIWNIKVFNISLLYEIWHTFPKTKTKSTRIKHCFCAIVEQQKQKKPSYFYESKHVMRIGRSPVIIIIVATINHNRTIIVREGGRLEPRLVNGVKICARRRCPSGPSGRGRRERSRFSSARRRPIFSTGFNYTARGGRVYRRRASDKTMAIIHNRTVVYLCSRCVAPQTVFIIIIIVRSILLLFPLALRASRYLLFIHLLYYQ